MQLESSGESAAEEFWSKFLTPGCSRQANAVTALAGARPAPASPAAEPNVMKIWNNAGASQFQRPSFLFVLELCFGLLSIWACEVAWYTHLVPESSVEAFASSIAQPGFSFAVHISG